MSNIFAILLQVVARTVSPASAQSPSAVVEEVGAGVTGVQFMDYELAGKSGAMVFRQAPKVQAAASTRCACKAATNRSVSMNRLRVMAKKLPNRKC
jgi:hypothetical protein